MSLDVRELFAFDNTFVRDLTGLYEPWQAAPAPTPTLLAFNDELSAELGLDPAALTTPDGVAVLVGNVVAHGSSPIAQAYAGHQFGGYSPRLGDGRALLLGEIIDIEGHRRDLHLKGSGRTPFARGGDGRAAVGPMLREYLIGEAMHALGIPTTRALAVVATGESIPRDTMLPGAVLCRVASSHLRVGTFQYASARNDPALLRRLADYAIARHDPDAASAANPYLTFFEGAVSRQASLIAQWMLVGFIHGVMNTDNMTISGETIDYGPCAFMDSFDPGTVFSSIDHAGRYAYGNQPQIAQWNLARLAEALLPLIDDDQGAAVEAVTTVLHSFTDRYSTAWTNGLHRKLGLDAAATVDADLADDFIALLRAERADFTGAFRSLSVVLRGDSAAARALFAAPSAFDAWSARWQTELAAQSRDGGTTASEMDGVNPIYIPRNHIVEAALTAGTIGDMAPFHRLLDAITEPFVERPGLEDFAAAAPESAHPYVTFCGT